MAEITWGTPLFFDLWAAGMAGGAYFAAFLLGLFGADKEKRLLKLATYIAVPLVLVGVVLIIADLGEPLRAFNMYIGLRPFVWQVVSGSGAQAIRAWPPHLSFFALSPMSLGGWALVFFSVFGVALIVLWLAEAVGSRKQSSGFVGRVGSLLGPLVPVTQVLIWVAFVFAILVMAYTGVVLAVSSMALWSATLLVPALFVTSAICTGVAALIIVAQLARPGVPGLLPLLRKALTWLILLQLLVLVHFVAQLNFEGLAELLIYGTPGQLLWIGAVALGLVVPLVLEFVASKNKATVSRVVMLVSAVLVVLGGLAMRAAVVIAGQL